jgi:hypothetical protein
MQKEVRTPPADCAREPAGEPANEFSITIGWRCLWKVRERHHAQCRDGWAIRPVRFMDGRVISREAEIEERALRSHAQRARSPQDALRVCR